MTSGANPMENIDTTRLNELQREHDDLLVLNVLSTEAYRERHIPGSESAPLGDDSFVENVQHMAGSRDRPVVVYCASRECEASEKAAAQLEQAGFDRVYDYTGGMREWQEAGQPVQAGVAPGA